MPSDYDRREQERERKWQREYEADRREKERLEEERHAKRMIDLERQRRQVATTPIQPQPPAPVQQVAYQPQPSDRQQLNLTLKTVGIGSIARFGCLWGLIVHGFLLGLCILPFVPFAFLAPARNGGGAGALAALAGLVLAYSLASAVATCILFTFTALSFNFVSAVSGGINLKLERRVFARYTPAPQQTIIPQQPTVQGQIQERLKRAAEAAGRSIYEED